MICGPAWRLRIGQPFNWRNVKTDQGGWVFHPLPGPRLPRCSSAVGIRENKLGCKGGDQQADTTIRAVKNVLRRRCELNTNGDMDKKTMAAAYSRGRPGLRNFGIAVRANILDVTDVEDPSLIM